MYPYKAKDRTQVMPTLLKVRKLKKKRGGEYYKKYMDTQTQYTATHV